MVRESCISLDWIFHILRRFFFSFRFGVEMISCGMHVKGTFKRARLRARLRARGDEREENCLFGFLRVVSVHTDIHLLDASSIPIT